MLAWRRGKVQPLPLNNCRAGLGSYLAAAHPCCGLWGRLLVSDGSR